MRISVCFFLLLLSAPSLAIAQNVFDPLGSQVRLVDSRTVAPHASADEIRYGERRWQEIEFFASTTQNEAPLVIIFANRGRRTSEYSPLEWLRHRALEAGYAVAMLPDKNDPDEPDERLENFSLALTTLFSRSGELGFDDRSYVLVGYHHARFATLYGTRSELLTTSIGSFDGLRGVIAFDGSAYDIGEKVQESAYWRRLLGRNYGREPEQYLQYSPASHLTTPNAPSFLLLAYEDEEQLVYASQNFAADLSGQGVEVKTTTYPATRSGRLNTYMLMDNDGAGSEIMPFLARAFANQPESSLAPAP